LLTSTKKQAPRPRYEKARAICRPGARHKFQFPIYTESDGLVNPFPRAAAQVPRIVQREETRSLAKRAMPPTIMAAFRRHRSAPIQPK
jgi:hypothetical protein